MKNFEDLEFPDYKDFKVIVRSREGRLEAHVVDSPSGHCDGCLDRPMGADESEDWLAQIEATFGEIFSSRSDGEAKKRARQRLSILQRDLGARLGAMLLTEEVAALFAGAEARVDTLARMQRADGLRFHLCFDPTDSATQHLAGLPWELMLHPRQQRPVFQDPDRWFVRYYETGEVIPEIEVDGPIKVMLVASEPKKKDALPLALEQEMNLISEALGQLDCEVETMQQPDLDGLCRRLRKGGFHILHFMGHGFFDREEGEGLLGFVDGEDTLAPVTGEMFGRRLAVIPSLQLVVLNACSTGALAGRAGQRAYASVASALLAAGVPAVVAMQFAISDTAAVEFSRAFYKSIAERQWLEQAMDRGRTALLDRARLKPEWATPVLFLRGRRGNLFGLSMDRLPATQHVGVRSFVEGFRADMPETCKPILELGEYFDPETQWREISSPSLWNGPIVEKIKAFAKELDERRPMRIELASHNSINFILGRQLATKAGLDLRVVQRGRPGEADWGPMEGAVPVAPYWKVGEPVVLDPQGTEVAFALAITIDVLTDVKVFVEAEGLALHSIIPFEIAGGAGQSSVQSGAHAVALADAVVQEARALPLDQRDACLHLFMAAPNTFPFFLGRESRHLGTLQLYEHRLGGKAGAYSPSIRIEALI